MYEKKLRKKIQIVEESATLAGAFSLGRRFRTIFRRYGFSHLIHYHNSIFTRGTSGKSSFTGGKNHFADLSCYQCPPHTLNPT